MEFTGKERDAETGLDYFGARYMSAAQGRFTSPDPLFFQAAMVIDPQRFNLYGYARNSPLMFVDPTGQEIELIGTEEQRAAVFGLLQKGLGKAGGLLEIKEKKGLFGLGKTHYMVKVTNGKESDFESSSAAASDVARIIGNGDTVKIGIAGGNEPLYTNRGRTTLNEERFSGMPGYFDPILGFGADLRSYIKTPGEPGTYGLDPGYKFEDGNDAPHNPMFTLFDELGHAKAAMQGIMDSDRNNKSALDLESKARKVQNPKAAKRIVH